MNRYNTQLEVRIDYLPTSGQQKGQMRAAIQSALTQAGAGECSGLGSADYPGAANYTEWVDFKAELKDVLNGLRIIKDTLEAQGVQYRMVVTLTDQTGNVLTLYPDNYMTALLPETGKSEIG